jgi:hypothetical protein
MTTIGNESKPAYVYDSETDTWVPIGIGPHTHDEFIDKTVITAKGDILVGTATDAVAKLGVGTTGQVLVVNPATATGLEWSNTIPQPITANSFSPTSSTIPTNGMYLGATNQVNIATDSTSRVTVANSGTTINNGFVTAARFIPTGSTVPSNGMYLASSNTLGFSTNTTNRLTIDSAGNSTFTGPVIGTPSESPFSSSVNNFGYKGIPKVYESGFGPYTVQHADAGKFIRNEATRTITIPSSETYGFEVGTTFVFASNAFPMSIQVESPGVLLLVGVGTAGTRTLSPYGLATAIQIEVDLWYISGNGLS